MKPKRNARTHTTPKPAAKSRARASSIPHSGNIAQFELSNGVHVLAYENFVSPAVVVNGYINVGARDEADRAKLGLAGFVTDCLSRGTRRYSYQQIFEATESIGASVGVSAGVHTTSFGAKSLAEDLPLMFELLGELVRHPTFPEDELEKERAEWLSDLEERANSARAMCGLIFSELCYPESHPYRWPSDGYAHTARAITRQDVLAFHRDYFAPEGMVVVVVGAVKAERARDLVAQAFDDWAATRPARAPFPAPPKIEAQRRKHVAMRGKTQTNLAWGLPGPARNDPDWLACALMNSILGQFGMYGRLGDSVRKEHGLVYYIGSSFNGGPEPGGAWQVYAGTNPKSVERVLDKSRAEVRRIQQRKVTPDELADNKSYFIGSMPLGLETNEGIAGQITSMIRYGRGLDYLLNFPARVNAVTRDDVQRVAQTWLDADKVVIASAGP